MILMVLHRSRKKRPPYGRNFIRDYSKKCPSLRTLRMEVFHDYTWYVMSPIARFAESKVQDEALYALRLAEGSFTVASLADVDTRPKSMSGHSTTSPEQDDFFADCAKDLLFGSLLPEVCNLPSFVTYKWRITAVTVGARMQAQSQPNTKYFSLSGRKSLCSAQNLLLIRLIIYRPNPVFCPFFQVPGSKNLKPCSGF
jgi:hypothetical protein